MAYFKFIRFTTTEYPDIVFSNKMQAIKPVVEKPLSTLAVGDKITHTTKTPFGNDIKTLTIKEIVETKNMGF